MTDEILAKNMFRLLGGKSPIEWAKGNHVLVQSIDFILRKSSRVLLSDLDYLAGYAGIEPWRLLKPLLGKGEWIDQTFLGAFPSFLLVSTPPATHEAEDIGTVVGLGPNKWTSQNAETLVVEEHQTAKAAYAAVEKLLFKGE